MPHKNYGLLFRAVCQLFKYFFLFTIGFAIACLLSSVLFGSPIASRLIELLFPWLWRSAILLTCLLTLAIILESIRE